MLLCAREWDMRLHWPRDAGNGVVEPWPQRWQAGWRKGARWFSLRRFVWFGALVGAGLVGLACDDQLHEHLQVADAVDRLAVQVALAQPVATVPAPDKPEPAANRAQTLPGQQTVTRVWPDLQQALTRHGLRVTSMRPLSEPVTDLAAMPWPSQAVALRMTGRFVDWQQAWIDLSAAGPVWSMDRLSVTPQNLSAMAGAGSQAGAAGVQVDAVLRVWLQPGPDGSKAWPMQQVAGATVLSPSRDEVFALALAGNTMSVTPTNHVVAGGPMPLVTDPSPILSADPLQWPLARVRLAGLWQQEGQWQAVLAAGPHVVRVRPGQRIAQEGWRIDAVQSASVRLRSVQGTLHELHLEGASP